MVIPLRLCALCKRPSESVSVEGNDQRFEPPPEADVLCEYLAEEVLGDTRVFASVQTTVK